MKTTEANFNRMKNVFLLFLLSVLFFCCGQENKNRIVEALDTAGIISDAHIKEFVSEIPDSLEPVLQTKTLAYAAFACDCPDYVNLSSKDSSGYYKEAYYVDPASEKLIIPDFLRVPYNEFEFKGIISQKNGLPKHYGFMDPNPPSGPVFTYWSYKIKRPYKFWGPKYQYIDLPNDTVEMTSKIEVK